MANEKIAVVEDDAAIRRVLALALKSAGYRVETADAGDVGLDLVQRTRPDLVLLDLMLPGLDGLTVCRRLRQAPETAAMPIIMLTAKGEERDVVAGLDAGANDYVTKPFDRAVLLARIRAVLRRGDTVKAGAAFDGLVLDSDDRCVTLNGAELKLTPGELRILALLISHRGRVLARSRILDAVQVEERSVTERTIDVQIANLRRKLGGWADHIETIRGIGYRVKA